MRRIFVPPCLAILVLIATTMPALATKPERTFSEAGPPFEVPAGVFCAFAVRIEVVVNQAYSLTFAPAEDGSQRIIFTGHITNLITNLSSGESMTFNASGPAVFTFAADGTLTIDGGGPWLVGLSPEEGGPVILWTFGRIHFDDAGIDLPNNTRDVCAILAE